MNAFHPFLAALTLCLSCAAAQAHVPFLKPNQFQVEHARLQVESAFTELPFQADFAMDSPHFALVQPDGSVQPLTPTAKTPAAVYLTPALTADGTYRITTGVRKGPLYKALETAEGKLYFADDMARHSGRPTRMQYFSRADAYLAKGQPRYTPRPLGQGVEIIPLASPHTLHAGGQLPLQVLKNGQPVPGARIVVAEDNEHYRQHRVEDLYDVENVRNSNLRADTQGKFSFRPRQAGLTLLFVTVHDKLPDGTWESHNAALTLETTLPEPPARR